MLTALGGCLFVSRSSRLACSRCSPPTSPSRCALTLTHSPLALTASLAARIVYPPQPTCPLAPGIAPSWPTPRPSADTHNPCTRTHHRPALSIPPPHVRPAPVHASSSACAPSLVTRTP
ncbi:hypothetical protein FIBSPDRAFT_857061 [Athelia psychrophila]|uniref:Uncharacterized protein n=1 Tax=Athelia psychrophila TaxID=1759441 RepID=A0A166MWR4_9AGAM|nr:hypothetical protein FIBSPDRAFT_857061 [Fibularhizoctonia sp. CBS 109695]